MTEKGHFTRQEILTQPEAWAAALEVLNGQRQAILDFGPALGKSVVGGGGHPYDQIIYTGCGSTYYLALAAAALTQELTGKTSRAFPASELWFYPQSSYQERGGNPNGGRTLLVAVSRSGETTETLRACEAFLAEGGGDLITLSCYDDQPLARMGILNLVLPSGQEQSVAQTRAFSTLYLATTALGTLWAGRPDLFDSLTTLPEAARRLLGRYAVLAAGSGRNADFDRFYWLGSGSRYGLACELSLKMKEMSLSHSEPFYFMEFRHGPKSMVTASTLILGLVSERHLETEMRVLEEMKAMGATALALGEQRGDIVFNSHVEEVVRNVLYLPFGQLLAFERSLSKGLDPDRPNNLDTVVRL